MQTATQNDLTLFTLANKELERLLAQPSNEKYDFSKLLEIANTSSAASYEILKSFLTKLESAKTQQTSRVLLGILLLQEKDNTKFFSIDTLVTDNLQNSTLKLLQLPSIFTPEEWSFTFFEGLSRIPDSDFQSKRLIELGCGNGWISLALAKKYQTKEMIGLDINPRSITCAKINLYLNALDDTGCAIRDFEGLSLLERVQFKESDLLSAVQERKNSFDRIIGCIPQVLNPHTSSSLQKISENSSDELLYDLSNYYENQGEVEDQFGLGLIARATEESIEVLKASGKMLFNLGGRPGANVLHTMFKRRGLNTKVIWSTKIVQASDTDIAPLIEIEKNTSHKFEFFAELDGSEKISATAAKALSDEGVAICHSLSVFEATMPAPKETKNLLHFLRQPDYLSCKSSMNLDCDNDELKLERLSFLTHIAGEFKSHSQFPYGATSGYSTFRRRIAQFFRSYYRLNLAASCFFVYPNRNSIVQDILYSVEFEKIVVDKKYLPDVKKVSTVLKKELVVVESPENLWEVCRFVKWTKPHICVATVSNFDSDSVDSLEKLFEIATQSNTLLLLDISEQIMLSSNPALNAVMRFLEKKQVPANVLIFFGLVKNKIYKDLEVAVCISENKSILDCLEIASEVSHSRTNFLGQTYYDKVLWDLLAFKMNLGSEGKLRVPVKLELPLPMRNEVVNALSSPAIASNELAKLSNAIRLDYGENELHSPLYVRKKYLESFLKRDFSSDETDYKDEFQKYSKTMLGIDINQYDIYDDNGVSALFSAVCQLCASKDYPIIFPTGCYNYFEVTAEFYGATIWKVKTKQEDSFKFTKQLLEQFFVANSKTNNVLSFVYLNCPIVNPSGAQYSQEEISQIAIVCEKYNAVLILDTIFSHIWEEVKTYPMKLACENIVLFGASKNLSCAGLRIGVAAVSSKTLSHQLQNFKRNELHSTSKFLLKYLLLDMISNKSELKEHFYNQQKILLKRFERIEFVLKKLNWECLPRTGGLFCLAKQTTKTAPSWEEIFNKTGVLFNSPEWTGVNEYCRIVLSVEEEPFERSLRLLERLATEPRN